MPEIYMITNLKNGNRYVGKTKNSKEKRFNGHLQAAKTGSTRLARAIKKYGKESFSLETLEVVLEQDLNHREIYFIKTLLPEYNMTAGGDGGAPLAEETRSILSFKAKERFKNIAGTFAGKKHTDEAKLKMSIANRGHNYEEKLRKKNQPKANRSEAMRGKNNPFAGRSHTSEAKEKMAAYRRGKVTPDEVKTKLSLASSVALSKTYLVVGPDSTKYLVLGLKAFCIEHGLVYPTLFATIKKKQASGGWLVARVE